MQEQTRLSVGRARGRNRLCRQAAERGKSDVKRRPPVRVDAWVREAGQRSRLLIAQTDKDNLQQPARVTPGDIYELELQAEADRPGKVFRLQVNWINKDGQI